MQRTPAAGTALGARAARSALALLALGLGCAAPLAPAETREPVECFPMLVRHLIPWRLVWVRGDVFTCANALAIEAHLQRSAGVDPKPL
jgi:hypothetical protein